MRITSIWPAPLSARSGEIISLMHPEFVKAISSSESLPADCIPTATRWLDVSTKKEIEANSLKEIRLTDEKSLASALMAPHRSYFTQVFPLLENGLVNAISHITGGGLIDNTSRVIPEDCSLNVDWNAWPRPEVFKHIQEHGSIEEEEMRSVFNLGIGLVLIVSENKAETVLAALEKECGAVYRIGPRRVVNILFCLVAGYLVGGIPFGLLITRIVKGIDPRSIGSGGTGATNVSRTLGKKWGIVVLLLDAAKGYFPIVFLTPLLMPENLSLGSMLLAASAMAGHVWTPYAGFRGGKGVATAAGAMGAIDPFSLVFALGIWVLTVVVFRFVSLASVMAAIVFPVIAWRIAGEITPIVYGGILIALFLIYTHRHNFKRIFSGTESKLF